MHRQLEMNYIFFIQLHRKRAIAMLHDIYCICYHFQFFIIIVLYCEQTVYYYFYASLDCWSDSQNKHKQGACPIISFMLHTIFCQLSMCITYFTLLKRNHGNLFFWKPERYTSSILFMSPPASFSYVLFNVGAMYCAGEGQFELTKKENNPPYWIGCGYRWSPVP